MIEFLSEWIKNLALGIVVVSILEMLIPNNKNKKYIKMVMGIYILFVMISPFVSNTEIFDLEEINIETSSGDILLSENSSEINQELMNKRIEEIYIEEIEKDVEEKLGGQGYEVEKCYVEVTLGDAEKESEISLIKVELEKIDGFEIEDEYMAEDIIIEEINKIKKVEIGNSDSNNNEEEKESTISEIDIQNIKKFLIEEYGVNERCLVIN